MSAPPILPGQNASPMPLRDTLHQTPGPSAHSVSAVARTLTTTAVKQAHATSESDDIARLKRAIMEDSRTQLAGPAPSFKVSLLQHVREAQADQVADVPEPEFPIPQTQGPPEDSESPAEHAAYKTLQGLSESENSEDPKLTRSI